nr:MAG TPA: hypothetical protein [Caudoviricetes sp.]
MRGLLTSKKHPFHRGGNSSRKRYRQDNWNQAS